VSPGSAGSLPAEMRRGRDALAPGRVGYLKGKQSPRIPLFPPAAARRPGATPAALPPRASNNRLVDPSPPEGDRVPPGI